MEANLMTEGVKFMFLGMGTVFVFLMIMIGAINIMSFIIHKFFPEPQAVTAKETVSVNTQQQDKKKIVAAITAAIAHHRQG
ncbi:MAG TPA: pyruvate carboxylase [Sulfurimonas autotrophica]|nr:pyruvate carboxylase [Sulfurimonas autotrophica]